MLRVAIELWPGGDGSRRSELAGLAVARIGECNDGRSRYATLVRRPYGPELGGQLQHVPRHGALELVRHAIAISDIEGAKGLPTSVRRELERSISSLAGS
jgi:hypothetical protein